MNKTYEFYVACCSVSQTFYCRGAHLVFEETKMHIVLNLNVVNQQPKDINKTCQIIM